MTTLSDVAKEANVSKMTVSRVINHPEQVTPELRAMVEKAMESLNYHPNSIAQALVNNRSNVVKFVTLEDIDTTEPYYMNLLFGFARGLNSKQYAMQLVTDPDQIEKGRADGYDDGRRYEAITEHNREQLEKMIAEHDYNIKQSQCMDKAQM